MHIQRDDTGMVLGRLRVHRIRRRALLEPAPANETREPRLF
jgi:hypothetical protein